MGTPIESPPGGWGYAKKPTAVPGVDATPTIPDDAIEAAEAYCVDSGYPVRYESGDRCIKHGNLDTPCFAALRDPRCTHPRWPEDANGSDKCPECGVKVP